MKQKTASAPDRIVWPEWMVKEESAQSIFWKTIGETAAVMVLLVSLYLLWTFAAVVGGGM